MDIYTLTEDFIANEQVEDRVSAIWTERYSSAGDTNIVVEASPENRELLKEGAYLALRGSKEVMEIKTANAKEGLLTVVGETLVSFLDERWAWFLNPDATSITDAVADYNDVAAPGQFIADVVDMRAINPVPFPSPYTALSLPGDAIPNLTLGPVDNTGASERLTAPVGPLYTSIKQVAEKAKVGITLYLESADEGGYSLKFSTYRGKDRTSGQSVNPLIRLSPDLETIGSIEEIRSIKDFKNVVYVVFQGSISTHYLDPSAVPVGMKRRVLVTDAEGEPPARKEGWKDPLWGGGRYSYPPDPAEVAAYLEQNAKDALANHNYIHAMDGETSPHSEYTFGVDYGLGDVIELEGLLGDITNAQVTEYIRTQDAAGEKEYPTISVVD